MQDESESPSQSRINRSIKLDDNNGWTEEREVNLKRWGEEAKGLTWMHMKCARWFNYWDKTIGIPTGLLAVLLSLVIFATYDNILVVRLIMGTVAFLVGSMSFMQNYVNWGRRSARHEEAMIQYQAMAADIEPELALESRDRQAGERYYKLMRARRQLLISAGYPSIIGRYLRRYEEKLSHSTITRANIAGNLTEINIHRAMDDDRPAPLESIVVDQFIHRERQNPAVRYELERYHQHDDRT